MHFKRQSFYFEGKLSLFPVCAARFTVSLLLSEFLVNVGRSQKSTSDQSNGREVFNLLQPLAN